jgi:hypothetical protein
MNQSVIMQFIDNLRTAFEERAETVANKSAEVSGVGLVQKQYRALARGIGGCRAQGTRWSSWPANGGGSG